MQKLAIITTHPIQYNAPWFKLLSERNHISVKVFYTWGQLASSNKYDPGFGKNIVWDIPLLDGYDFTFVNNISKDPGSHHFKGIDNPSLISEIGQWDPDAILVFGWCFKSHLKILRYYKGKKTILFRGDSNLIDIQNGFSVKNILRKIFLKWVYNYIDIALYVGSANKAYFKKYGLRECQLKLAPHAIDNDRFSNIAFNYNKASLDLRKQLGIEASDLVLLFAGKMEEKKNPFFFIDILNAITDERLKVIFVGSGLLRTELLLAASKDKRIIVLDFQNQLNMPIIYRLADIFILPSKGPGETWGLALNEAMACGKVVVASNKTGGAQDLIDNNNNGFLIDINNNTNLISFIRQSLNDKNLLLDMGKKSSLKIKEFTFDGIVKCIETIMRNLK